MIKYKDNKACFNGNWYLKDSLTGYYLSSNKIDGRRERLHISVWKYFNGDIPKNYHIHHKDLDKNNNDISNLELLTSKEHLSLHANLLNKEKLRNHILKQGEKAKEWHKSEEGKNWHKEHYEKTKEKLYVRIKVECNNCGLEFDGVPNRSQFCSNKCKTAFRKKSGVDNIEVVCICGNKFIKNKYSPKKYCGKGCKRNGKS